jgi:hypothetical protein
VFPYLCSFPGGWGRFFRFQSGGGTSSLGILNDDMRQALMEWTGTTSRTKDAIVATLNLQSDSLPPARSSSLLRRL